METKVKNREWVKDAAIIFLVVLLILTFFSNTIMNRTLPEVATAEVTNGAIVAKVRGSGTVTANGKHQVKAKEIRTIRSVMIKAGQEVNAGDVLFVLGEGDATALEQAKEKLRDLQYSYQRMAVSLPNFDYTTQYRAIDNANKALADAQKAEADALFAWKNFSPEAIDINSKLEELEAELKTLDKELKEAEADFDTRYQAAIEAVKEAQAEYDKYVDDESGSGTGGESGGGTGGESGGGTGGESGGGTGGESGGGTSGETGGETGGGTDGGTGGETGGETSSETNSEPESAVQNTLQESASPSTASENEEVSTNSSNETAAELSALTFRVNSTRLQKSRIRPIVTGKRMAETDAINLTPKEEAYIKLQAAKAALDSMSKDSDSVVYAKRSQYEEAKKLYDTLVNYRNQNISPEEIPYLQAYEKAKAARIAAENALYDAEALLAYAQETNSRSTAASYVDLQQAAEQIALQQEKIKSLAGDEENVITANVSGTVDTVDCTAGDTVLKDALLCTIEVPDMGHTLSFSVTNDQAQRLRIGDTATVSNYYWGNSITATLTTIRTDPKNPQSNKLLTFDLTGDVTTGAELTISVGQKSANYDLIVPNSAIKSDTNGNYVLAVSVKNSPLGNRYTARRVSVEVLANDDNNSAVVADLGNGDYVITTSSAPLSSGDMVRMADS